MAMMFVFCQPDTDAEETLDGWTATANAIRDKFGVLETPRSESASRVKNFGLLRIHKTYHKSSKM